MCQTPPARTLAIVFAIDNRLPILILHKDPPKMNAPSGSLKFLEYKKGKTTVQRTNFGQNNEGGSRSRPFS